MTPKVIKLRHVQQLHLSLNALDVLDPRCIHWEVPGYPSERDDVPFLESKPAALRMQDLTNRALALLSRFDKGQLVAFSWELGSCLPVEVLQRLASRQKRIQSLRLATDGHCEKLPVPDPLSSVKFDRLESFTWSGVTDLFAANCFLYRHRAKLQHVELAMSSHAPRHNEKSAPSDGFANHIWKENRRPPSTSPTRSLVLHSVQVLCLSRMPVAASLLTKVVDMSTLSSLTLRECPGWSVALSVAAKEISGPFRLRTLEIQSAMEVWHDDGSTGLDWSWLAFFKKTVHLKKLFLGLELLTEEEAGLTIWEAIDVLCDVLTDLVIHFRERSSLKWQDDAFDAGGGCIVNPLTGLCSWNPLAAAEMEALGISCSPKNLMTVLKPYASKKSLRFLHIRQTKTDVGYLGSYAFVDMYDNTDGAPLLTDFTNLMRWAFGPHGIQSLEAMAFGEFANGWPLPGHSFFVKRNRRRAQGYDIVEVHSDQGSRLLTENRTLLEACPLVQNMVPNKGMDMGLMTKSRLQRPCGYYEGDTDDESKLGLHSQTEEAESDSDLDAGYLAEAETPAQRYRRVVKNHQRKRRKIAGGWN
ncbi:hypothetical protein XA68_12293 [Ophiocordyceps unilateralis]|uniref:Uncharacterized protein n=1 Tax=Ophiocordyceps unilateralis TaxID=268505 RepID=A0A2A9PEN0_OPHUN|nr:hypothetical protein XA68_12293 [Ophiocordyceps unilateralis]